MSVHLSQCTLPAAVKWKDRDSLPTWPVGALSTGASGDGTSGAWGHVMKVEVMKAWSFLDDFS